MKVGDLVKYKRDMFRESAPMGLVVKPGAGERPAWWSILWPNGKTEIVSDRNLKVIHASR